MTRTRCRFSSARACAVGVILFAVTRRPRRVDVLDEAEERIHDSDVNRPTVVLAFDDKETKRRREPEHGTPHGDVDLTDSAAAPAYPRIVLHDRGRPDRVPAAIPSSYAFQSLIRRDALHDAHVTPRRPTSALAEHCTLLACR